MTIDQSPSLQGFRLGMRAEQVFALFPEVSVNKNAEASAEGFPNYGVARSSFQPRFFASKTGERFAGIDSIQLTLFDGSLTEFEITYAGYFSHPARGPSWRSVDEFIAQLSEAFALPPATDWVEQNPSAKTLQCAGFKISASITNGTGSISLRSTTAYENTVRQRALADEERMRRECKP